MVTVGEVQGFRAASGRDGFYGICDAPNEEAAITGHWPEPSGCRLRRSTLTRNSPASISPTRLVPERDHLVDRAEVDGGREAAHGEVARGVQHL